MIAIIGRGNVASHLYEAFRKHTDVSLVNPHTLEGLPTEASLILIAVSDKAIGEVIAKLPPFDGVVAHTAGSIPIDVFEDKFKNYGVFYPLQTFTKGVSLRYEEIPVFLEGNSKETLGKLKDFAVMFTEDVREADSDSRKRLHLASVFACNFTNAMAGVAQDILKDTGIDFSALLPLLKQTVNKLDELSPKEAQTGPAVRNDRNVMESHLKMLESNPKEAEIYKLISEIISKNAET